MKKALRIFIIVLVALFVLSIVKDMVIKTAVEKGVEIVTGLQLRLQAFNVGILRPVVGIKGMELMNPKGFKDRVMLNMPEVYVDYDLPSILGGKTHLREVRIDLAQFVVVKNADGKLNLDSLKVVQAQKAGETPAQTEKAAGKKAPEFQIDSLSLKIGKVMYIDYSGATPSTKEFDLNIDEKFTNIKDPYAVVSIVVVKALMNTTIGNLTNFDVKGLSGTVSGPLQSAQKVVGQTAVQAQKAAAGATETATKAAKTATETIDKTTKSLMGMFGTSEEKK